MSNTASAFTPEGAEKDRNQYHREQQLFNEFKESIPQTVLANNIYTNSVMDYLRCTMLFMSEFEGKAYLRQQLTRTDLDTVCAFELYTMKKELLMKDNLDYGHFIKHMN